MFFGVFFVLILTTRKCISDRKAWKTYQLLTERPSFLHRNITITSEKQLKQHPALLNEFKLCVAERVLERECKKYTNVCVCYIMCD